MVEADDLDSRLLVAQHGAQVVLDEARLEGLGLGLGIGLGLGFGFGFGLGFGLGLTLR